MGGFSRSVKSSLLPSTVPTASTKEPDPAARVVAREPSGRARRGLPDPVSQTDKLPSSAPAANQSPSAERQGSVTSFVAGSTGGPARTGKDF